MSIREADHQTTVRDHKKSSVLKYTIAGIAGLGILCGLAGASMLLGFRAFEREFFPAAYLEKANNRVNKLVEAIYGPEQVEDTVIGTNMIQLVSEVAVVDTGRESQWNPIAENGGGLTSFGDDVLLLPYDGKIYAASEGGTLRDTGIRAPYNGRDEYVALATNPDYSQYKFYTGYLRYNDIEAFDGPLGKGVVISYTEFYPDEDCYGNTIARLDFDAGVTSIDQVAAGPDDWEIIYRSKPCLPLKLQNLAMEGHTAGGKMVFEAPSTIYFAAGDYHFDELRSKGHTVVAQDPSAEYGKMLKIDLYSGQSDIFSIGHRNPQGLAIMPDGRLWAVEHGPNGGDELNLIREGVNYGWPRESYGVTYRANTRLPNTISYARHDTYEQPKFAWVPSVATSGLAYIDGVHETWDGDLLVASLIDLSLYRVRLQGDEAIYAERIEIGQRIRDVQVHNGRIVLWTDNRELIFLTPKEYESFDPLFERFQRDAGLSDEMAAAALEELDGCAQCHSYELGADEKAPSLSQVFNSPIASTKYEAYSTALSSKAGTWTTESLNEFLKNPDSFARGTTMPDPGLSDDELRLTVIGFLEALKLAF